MKVGFWIALVILIIAIAIVALSKPDEISVTKTTMETLTVSSTAFAHNGLIPSKYGCDGAGISPPLTISGVPSGSESLVLIMSDPDAPGGTWDHWVMYNIPPTNTVIEEGEEPAGKAGVNSWGRAGYGGPCPPDKEHRYSFKTYALDILLELQDDADRKEVEKAIQGHVIAEGELIGRYNRSEN